MKIQASILASISPLANFLSHLAEQGFEGKEDEYVQVSDVMDVMKSSLMLTGNASHYITHTRRKSIIEATKKSRPKLANFLQDICKEDLGDTGEDLFGPLARKKIVERANTIEAFNKALSKVDPPSKKSNNQQGRGGRFLSKGSDVSYRGGSSRIATPYNRRQVQPGKRIQTKKFLGRKPFSFKEKPVKPIQEKSSPVGGALQAHWTTLTDNPWILQSVLGHRLEWNQPPPPCH